MKNVYPKLLFFFLPFVTAAQLHIQKNTTSGSTDNVYIYNKGEILYVKKDISLKDGSAEVMSGNIYLRDEGQLIQGDEANANSGTGIVSVYQEGNVNQWDYHFWASPVSDPLTASLTAAPQGNTNLNLASPNTSVGKGGGLFYQVDNTKSNPASFTANTYDGSPSNAGSAVIIANYWLYKYVLGAQYADYVQIRETGDLKPGEGFTMKGVGGGTGTIQRYDFRGRPNNGTIEVAVAKDENTLVGNPYPSAMDLGFYLLSNSGKDVSNCRPGFTPMAVGDRITGVAYFWESDPLTKSHYLVDYQGGYGTYSPISCLNLGVYVRPTFSKYDRDGLPVSGNAGTTTGALPGRRYAPVGQGFFVVGSSALTANSTVVAKNEFRVFQKENNINSTFKKAERKEDFSAKKAETGNDNIEERLPEIRLLISINDTYMRELVTAFYDYATPGFDRAADGRNISFLKTDISYHFEDSAIPYNINVLPYDIESVLPLIISAGGTTNNYDMRVSENTNNTNGVWLWDKEEDTYHDVLKTNYMFSLPQGTYTDRFAIVFKDNSDTFDIADEIKSSFDVVQNNKLSELSILNPRAEELKEIAIFDLSGKQVIGKLNEGTNQKVRISSANWSDGIYIVRVVTRDNIEFSKKVSVVNIN